MLYLGIHYRYLCANHHVKIFYSYFPALFIFIIYLVASNPALAAAWTQGDGIGQAIFSIDSYGTSSVVKNSNMENATSRFSKYTLNPYIEYGLRSDITIGANPILQNWQSRLLGVTTSGQTVESEFFVRKKLLEPGNAVFSVQPMVKIPCVAISGPLNNLGCSSYDLELRLLAGYGFKLEQKISDGTIRPFSGQYHFVDIETAYRKHTDGIADVIKIDGNAGFRYSESVLLLGQFFSTISTGSSTMKIDSADRSKDLKLQLSMAVQTGKSTSLQVGVYQGFASRNSDNGHENYQGLLLSLWKGF
jgi:hypothetical protein